VANIDSTGLVVRMCFQCAAGKFYLPILTLEGIEGKLFRPMALTVIFALLGSMIISLTLMPVLASLLLPGRPREREHLLTRVGRLCIGRSFAPP
jgi:Cu/Ag efflux pump CusA